MGACYGGCRSGFDRVELGYHDQKNWKFEVQGKTTFL